jgi:hypothetical protein
MSFDVDYETTLLSAHVKYGARETVVDALVRLEVGRGVPIPVWPPRPLPGPSWSWLFISPVRNGWVSLWSRQETMREWFPRLTATLECAGVLFGAIESEFWTADFFQDGALTARSELPTETWEEDLLASRAAQVLEDEGMEDPWEHEERLEEAMEEIAASETFQEELLEARGLRPTKEVLKAFLPPYASAERALELLTAIDRHESETERAAEEPPDAQEYLEAFASYLGIHDAAWNFQEDVESIGKGDYDDEEGLPEGWDGFAALPHADLPVL